MQRRQPDRLTEFSHWLAQIKFIILEIVIFIGFLLWLYDKVKHDFNVNFSPTSAHAAETHPATSCFRCSARTEADLWYFEISFAKARAGAS